MNPFDENESLLFTYAKLLPIIDFSSVENKKQIKGKNNKNFIF